MMLFMGCLLCMCLRSNPVFAFSVPQEKINMSYPTTILRNTATERYHPMPFRPSPRPSDDMSDGYCRYRSIGHHTEGFDTLKDAIAHITESPNALIPTGVLIEWDGESSPHSTMDFQIAPPVSVASV